MPLTTTIGTPPLAKLDEPTYSLSALEFSNLGAVIGNYPGQSFWSGQLDEFCMWSRQLTALEVRQMYESGNPGQ